VPYLFKLLLLTYSYTLKCRDYASIIECYSSASYTLVLRETLLSNNSVEQALQN
jgi:hypothetical protein